jgi:hypothetical protein
VDLHLKGQPPKHVEFPLSKQVEGFQPLDLDL